MPSNEIHQQGWGGESVVHWLSLSGCCSTTAAAADKYKWSCDRVIFYRSQRSGVLLSLPSAPSGHPLDDGIMDNNADESHQLLIDTAINLLKHLYAHSPPPPSTRITYSTSIHCCHPLRVSSHAIKLTRLWRRTGEQIQENNENRSFPGCVLFHPFLFLWSSFIWLCFFHVPLLDSVRVLPYFLLFRWVDGGTAATSA